MTGKRKHQKCICENPYGIEEAILLDRECPIHGDNSKLKRGRNDQR